MRSRLPKCRAWSDRTKERVNEAPGALSYCNRQQDCEADLSIGKKGSEAALHLPCADPRRAASLGGVVWGKLYTLHGRRLGQHGSAMQENFQCPCAPSV